MLTITIIDSEWFNLKGKLVIYIKAFVELYSWRSRGQVGEIYRIIEFEEMYTSTVENLPNNRAYQLIKILLVLRSIYMILKNQRRVVFCINNYSD